MTKETYAEEKERKALERIKELELLIKHWRINNAKTKDT